MAWYKTTPVQRTPKYNVASGTVANFETNLALPMKSVVANIVPIQSGSGTPSPSNPRPISGTDELTLTRTGANLFPFGTVSGTTYAEKSISLEASTYTLSLVASGNSSTQMRTIFQYTDNSYGGECLFNKDTREAKTVTLSKPVKALLFYAADTYPSSVGFTFEYSDIQIELGSTATTYEPYNAETYTFDLGQEIMGGMADVVGGTGEETHKAVDLGSLTWTYHPASGQYSDFFDCYLPSDSITGSSGIAFDGLCSIYKSIPSANIATSGYDNNVMALAQGTRRFIVCDQRFTSKNDFVAGVTGITLVYPLETPTEYTFTGQPINSYLGVNNVYTDSGEVLDVEYAYMPTGNSGAYFPAGSV